MVKQIGRGDLTLIDFNDVTASLTAPQNPSEGSMWFNQNDYQLYIYTTGKWVLSTKGMEFGGRNLLKKSNNFTSGWTIAGGVIADGYIELTGNNSTNLSFGSPVNLENNQVYTVQVKIWSNVDLPSSYNTPFHTQTNNASVDANNSHDGGSTELKSETLLIKEKWHTVVKEIKTVSTGEITFRPYIYGLPIGAKVRVKEFKVEKGNTASDWTPAPEDIEDAFINIMETLGNMANDNLLNYEERKVLTDKLTEVTGIVIADTATAIPTTAVLDAGKKGDFYSVRQSALNAGLLKTDAVYVDVATKYNLLGTYLNGMSPVKPWDLRVANQHLNIAVVKNTFRTNWLNYFTAINTLATATAEKLKKNVDDITVGGSNVARNGNFGTMLNDSGWKESYIGGIKEIVDISTETPPFQYALHINNTTNGNGGIFSPVLWSGATAEALVDKEVTLSFWLKYQNIAQGVSAWNLGRFGEIFIDGLTTTSAIVSSSSRIDATNATNTIPTDNFISGSDMVWKKYTITTKLSLPPTAVKLSKITFRHGLDTCRGEFWTTGIQIEMGNKASDWKYSDEDMNQRVTGAEFKVSDSSIISVVTSSQPWTLETAKIANATNTISDMMNDLKITPIEKSSLKTLWDEIQAKYTQILALANTGSIGVSATAFTNAYNALNSVSPRIQTDILANMTTTYTLTSATRDSFKAQINTFYVESEKINKAISDKINATANLAKAGVDDMLSDLKITPLEKNELLRNWQKIQAQYVELNAQAVTLGVSSAIRTSYTNAYNALNTTSPRIQTDILASMTTVYVLTTATRDIFKAQLNTYFVEAEKISRANTDSIQSYATRIEQKADGIVTTVSGINTRLGTAETKISQTSDAIALKVSQTDVNTSIVNAGKVKDTRNTNQPPSWYWTNYPAQTAEEFKSRTVVGALGTSLYGQVTTKVPYPDSSGGAITQTFYSSDGVCERKSVGTTAWTTWVQLEDTLGSQKKVDDFKRLSFDPLASRVSTAELKITSEAITGVVKSSTEWTEQTLAITNAQDKANLVGNKIDNLKIGGRNLIANSTFNEDLKYWSLPSSHMSVIASESDKPNSKIIYSKYTDAVVTSPRYHTARTLVKADGTEDITVSMDIYASNLDSISNIITTHRLSATQEGAVTSSFESFTKGEIANVFIANTWIRVSKTIKIPSNTSKWLIFGLYNSSGTIDFKVREIKLELGNVATDWTPAPEDIDNAVKTSQSDLSVITGAINDMSSDLKLTSLEKQSLRRDWDRIKAEYIQVLSNAQSPTVAVSTTAFVNAYNAIVNTVPRMELDILANMSTTYTFTSTSARDSFRIQATTYFSELEKIRKAINDKINATANSALVNSATANSLLSDLSSDMKVTPLEKNNLKTTWESIKAEYTQLLASANILSVSATAYTTAYNAIVSTVPRIDLDVLVSMTTTYTFGTTAIRDSFRSQFNTYFVEAEKISKAITDKIQSNANKAQTDANTANTAITDMASDSKITPVEKVQLKKEWAVIASEKVSLDGVATTFGITTEKTNLNNAYVVLNNVLNTATTGILANMAINSTIVGSTFRGQFDDYYEKKAVLQRKVSESARALAVSGIGQGQITINPIFADWTSTYPTGFNPWSTSTGFSKETVLTKNGGYGARFKITTATTQIGMEVLANATITNQKEPAYVVVEVDYMLVSGAITGAGILLDWGGLASNRETIRFETENPSPTLNKWYTVRKLVPKPSSATGVFSNMIGFVMANYASIGAVSIKDIIFDRYSLREPTEEEIKAYNSAIMIDDMSSDSKITPVEKVQLKKEWQNISSERVSIDGMASTFGITTERTNMTNSYNALNTLLNGASGVLANIKTTSTVVATTFRATFDDYYDKKAVLQRKVSETARTLATSAQTSADTANTAISDILSDLKITPVEKSSLKVTWDEIQAKYANSLALGNSLGVSTTALTSAFTVLNSTVPRIQTDVLAVMNTTYTLTTATRDSFKAQLNAFFVQSEAISKAISEKVNGNASTAQSGVNDLLSDLKITPLEKSELQRTWEIIKAQYSQLYPQGIALNADVAIRTAYTNAYNALNLTAPRIQTDILASMTTTYALTTATRDTFKTQMNTYFAKAEEMSKAITDKIDSNTKTVQSNVDALSASTGNLVNNPSVSGSASKWSDTTLATEVFEGVSIAVLRSISSSNLVMYSDYFEVDPSKSYEVSMWVKKSQPTPASTNFYLGTNQLSDTGASIAITPVSSTTGSIGTDSTNFYFLNRSGTSSFSGWEKITAYILSSGFDTTNSKGLSSAEITNAMMKPNTKKIRLRILNYSNTTALVGTTWVAHPKVVEIPTELVTKVSSSVSSVTQLANDITQKVSKTDYTGNTITSMINQTATTIKLKAENIELNGITTVANRLNIGSNFADSTYKVLKFRGDDGYSYIESTGSDTMGIFAFAYVSLYGGGTTMVGNDGSGDILNSSSYTDVDATRLVRIRTKTNTLSMNDTSKVLTLNGIPIGSSDNPILWSGSLFMSDTHSITPSKKLSECTNGWILMWSRYVNGATSNTDWNTSVVPKSYPDITGGGMWCPLVAVTGNPPVFAYKYMYATDTKMIGHSRNNTGAESGQVLRYVMAY